MSGFVFQVPGLLLLLALALPLGWLLARARRRRQQVMDALGAGPCKRRRLSDALRVLGFAMLVLALARPGYAPRYSSIPHSGRDVVFVLDVSQSMLAGDAPPSRLEVAKQGVRDALDALSNERAGLLVYAGSASILCPLTYDYDFVRYMLDQANPRTVDFGGTAMQSAVEKAVDQVFLEGRGNVQDLVVITDGGDQGSKVARMIELLEEKQVDVLVIGVGDPDTGSPIPIQDAEGNPGLLEQDGATVYTKLDDGALRDFAARSKRIDYVPVGVAPFNLGRIYRDYAKDRQVDSTDGETGILIYQEAAVFFLVPALMVLFLAERGKVRWPGNAAALCFTLVLVSPLGAATASFSAEFGAAVESLRSGDFEKAESRLSELYHQGSDRSASPEELAALQFNRGLCLVKLAEAGADTTPVEARDVAANARLAFLTAKQLAPGLERAGRRIESTTALLGEIQKKIEAREKADRELEDAIKKLIEHLQATLGTQQKLRSDVLASDVDRNPPRPARNAPAPSPVAAPDDAPVKAREFVGRENALHADSESIEAEMRTIDGTLKAALAGQPPADTLMTRPLQLMAQVEDTQAEAADELRRWDTWPGARALQQKAGRTIGEILELLSNNSDQQSDDGEASDEMEEDYDSEYSDEGDKGVPQSQRMTGDFAADSEMRELPVPNYSADDILTEEKGNMQFREQKRAGANASKVEKDY